LLSQAFNSLTHLFGRTTTKLGQPDVGKFVSTIQRIHIAEELTIGSITTGAGNDLERATDLARRMVCEWGMSNAMGPLTFGKKEEQIFLGREIAQHSDYSEDTALRIDQEVKRFVTDNYARAQAILADHRQALLDMADALLSRETLDADQVRRLAAGLPLDEKTGSEGTPPNVVRDAKPAKERPAASIVPPMPTRPLTQE
jgi:cell division protease FtsH